MEGKEEENDAESCQLFKIRHPGRDGGDRPPKNTTLKRRGMHGNIGGVGDRLTLRLIVKTAEKPAHSKHTLHEFQPKD